jgi:hypothetical protein
MKQKMSEKTKKQSIKIDIVESIRKLKSLSESLRNLSSDIRKDDRLAVIIFCASVESVLDFFVEKVCSKHGSKLSGRNRSFMTKVFILDEFDAIDDKILNNLTNLKELRDKAAHYPAEELEWKGKFAFDKNGTVYKETLRLFGKPEDLVGYLFYVWNTFFLVACEEIPKRELGKIAGWQTKLAKNNK